MSGHERLEIHALRLVDDVHRLHDAIGEGDRNVAPLHVVDRGSDDAAVLRSDLVERLRAPLRDELAHLRLARGVTGRLGAVEVRGDRIAAHPIALLRVELCGVGPALRVRLAHRSNLAHALTRHPQIDGIRKHIVLRIHRVRSRLAPGVRSLQQPCRHAIIDRVCRDRRTVAQTLGLTLGEHALDRVLLGEEIDHLAIERELLLAARHDLG